MAVKAYVLITADTAKTKEVVKKLQKVKGTEEVNEVMGPYDIVVELVADEFDHVTEILRNNVRPIDGIRNTLTCVVMHT
ncbi:MAG: Lrp/AsnC ligand binding domain-containing protein [Chloroflexi bacterium]|nr:Lrp/AsnC ligand binding domain-containing protein [Chloroflexota bacterium]